MNLSPDFKDFLRAFADADVHYLVVGGYAVSFHARPRFTKDLDVWVEDTDQPTGGYASKSCDTSGGNCALGRPGT